MSNKDVDINEIQKDSIEAMDTEPRRIGTMDTTAYQAELGERTDDTPLNVDTKSQIIKIAKGTGIKTFQNPQQLAISLSGFEDWCLKKNITPSFVGIAVYLNCSKSTVLKYAKDTEQYTVMIVQDNITGNCIYSTTVKKNLDIYVNTYNEIDSNGNTVSIKSKIEEGIYSIVYSSVSFADVMAPVRSLIELSTTNRAWTLKNPALPIFLMKNKFGETENFTDRQEVSISAGSALDDMDDAAVIRAAQSRPEG